MPNLYPDLYPVFEAPDIVQQSQSAVIYGESWGFDFKTGQFVKDSGNRLRKTDGHSAWVQWCIKAILTMRFAHVAYSYNYGLESDEITQQPDRASKQAEMERGITETILSDPRAEWVRDFAYTWSGDSCIVSFTLKPKIGPITKMEVTLDE